MGKRNAHEWMYATATWRRVRARHLASHPLCARCLSNGVLNDGSRDRDGKPLPKRKALVVDHVTPHRGDWRLFLEQGNLQTLCADHHAAHKTPDDRRGYSKAIGADGFPVDPRHPYWHAD